MIRTINYGNMGQTMIFRVLIYSTSGCFLQDKCHFYLSRFSKYVYRQQLNLQVLRFHSLISITLHAALHQPNALIFTSTLTLIFSKAF